MSTARPQDREIRPAHRRQAIRRHAQRHHWRFYKSRSDWSFIANFARAPIRWGGERWVLSGVSGLLVALAFVVLPGWTTAVRAEFTAPPALVSTPIPLPPPSDALRAPAPVDAGNWRSVEVRRGQTMGEIFASLGLSAELLHRVAAGAPRANGFRAVRPGQRFDFDLAADGRLRALAFDLDESNRLEITLTRGEVAERVIPRDLERRVRVAEGRIHGSLFGAGEEAGLSDPLILALANVFAYDIDFAQDLRRGDRFSVIYEELYRDGERLRDGAILAASFTNAGKRHVAVRFVDENGQAGYFDLDGRPLRKAFLRTPVDFTRISSRFSTARKHPILGLTRAHRGVDYAAPRGTPVKAAGAGRVSFRGWKSGYGNCVIVDHGNQRTTLYAHLASFASGLKVGSRVSQGQTLGGVGMTGLATAPHLHYEFRIGGVHRDPLSIELPRADPLAGPTLSSFRAVARPLTAQLERVEQRADALAAR